jgi:putative restriction endonuclease
MSSNPHSLAVAPDAVLRPFADLAVWERKGERAPHKPLLVLYALGQWEAGRRDPIPYAEVEKPLRTLLQVFGPPRRSYHPEFPFWHLQSDGIWIVHPMPGQPPRKLDDRPPVRDLRAGVTGEFSPEVKAMLTANPELVAQIAHVVLDRHFPPSYHEDILTEVGLDLRPTPRAVSVTEAQRRRDPEFRDRVLTAYGRRCAVCGIGVFVGRELAGLDAAHIRWWSHEGPDRTVNGICLCVLHHKLFDRGAFTVLADGLRVSVSEHVSGEGAEDVLHRHEGRPISLPRQTEHHPVSEFLDWHHRQVFKYEPLS